MALDMPLRLGDELFICTQESCSSSKTSAQFLFVYQCYWDWHWSQYYLSALELCMLPTEGIREKDMKKGHEVMKNPVLRQLGVGS